MNIKEFAATYCQDIITAAQKSTELFDLDGFSYDEIIVEDDGTKVRVVNTDNYQIPITDILSMDRETFARVWPSPDCLDAYDSYVKNLEILEGAEALEATRNMLRREQDRIQTFAFIPEVYID